MTTHTLAGWACLWISMSFYLGWHRIALCGMAACFYWFINFGFNCDRPLPADQAFLVEVLAVGLLFVAGLMEGARR